MSEHVDLGWCIIEQLGHRVIAGFASEVEIAGAGFLRVDLWAEDGEPTTSQFIAPSSIYAITPTTEGAVRERMRPRPFHRLALVEENDPFAREDEEDEPDQ